MNQRPTFLFVTNLQILHKKSNTVNTVVVVNKELLMRDTKVDR